MLPCSISIFCYLILLLLICCCCVICLSIFALTTLNANGNNRLLDGGKMIGWTQLFAIAAIGACFWCLCATFGLPDFHCVSVCSEPSFFPEHDIGCVFSEKSPSSSCSMGGELLGCTFC